MVVFRSVIDLVLPGAGPFALVYPTVMVATLYGAWRGGLAAYVLAFAWAWYVVLPNAWTFHFADPADAARVGFNAASALVVLLLAEAFRRAVERSRAELQRALARRATLLTELDHRTKNNFALVASVLEIQKRRQEAPGLREALDDAIGRVRAFAAAYSNLAHEQQEGAEVAMKPYLEQLLERVATASFHERVRVEHSIADMNLPRETGVGIGLFLNEAVSNAAKHAFGAGQSGSVRVTFAPAGNGWRLVVEDDGGATALQPAGGLGSSLMAAFARQARAEHLVEIGERGYRQRLFCAGE
jgi:two-component sensor histidine kinase